MERGELIMVWSAFIKLEIIMYKIIHRAYIFTITLIAVTIYTHYLLSYRTDISILDILFWGFFAIIAETFLISLPNGVATSVGMAVYLAALITTNPLLAVSLPILSFLFRMPDFNGERRHLFTYNYLIVLYNISSHIIFIGTIGKIYTYLKLAPNDFGKIIPVALILLSLSEFISILLISIFFLTRDTGERIPLFRSVLRALPNSWAVGALGLILAFADHYYGKSAVLIVFIPLLLARYSFKLYFDSQKTGQETIEALDAALQYRDAYTAGHTSRVKVYTVVLAKKMGYHGKDLERIEKAALLHDIGKIGVPDRILNKPGKLTDEEYQRIKDHAAMGAQILSNVDGFKRITEIVRQHHERPDGRGYPDGLVGDEISLDASMLSIADTYDAMTSERPYRKAMTKEYAFSELRKYRGTQFRDELVDVFIECIEDMDEMALEFELPETYDDLLEKTKQEEIEKESTEVVYDS